MVARRFLVRVALMALIWIGLNGTDGNSWIVGGPMVLASAWLSDRMLSATPLRWSLRGVIRFGGYFLWESLRGGWGVARFALSARPAFSPGFLCYKFRIQDGPARWFFCNTISLMPGTAVVTIEGDSLCAHVLDLSPQSAEELTGLERRIAALFGLDWPENWEATS
jgi:multicomponent Na+:H+ antiporter subunit E